MNHTLHPELLCLRNSSWDASLLPEAYKRNPRAQLATQEDLLLEELIKRTEAFWLGVLALPCVSEILSDSLSEVYCGEPYSPPPLQSHMGQTATLSSSVPDSIRRTDEPISREDVLLRFCNINSYRKFRVKGSNCHLLLHRLLGSGEVVNTNEGTSYSDAN